MDLYEELVDGPGYAVCSIENMQLFKKLRDSFLDKINITTESEKDINMVRKTMIKMCLAEINKLRTNLLTFTDLSDMMINSCPSLIETLCGKELFIQRRAITIINVPSKEHSKHSPSRIWNHYELKSGISPFTWTLWAPLHDLEDEGGIYCFDQKKSLEVLKEEQLAGLVNGPAVLSMMKQQKPSRLKFGQAVIFNPFVLHGNIAFNSKFSRIACSVRFQSYNKPLLQKNSDFLKYYRLP